jgi:ABC-type transport system substrate-binding protein
MNARLKIFGLLILAALVLAACAPASVQAAQGSPTPPPSTTPTGAASGTPDPGSTPTITLDNNNQLITLHVNETFLLKLGDAYDWTINVDNQGVVSRIPYIAVIRGAQGVYLAHQPGTATLTATGDPFCRQSVPACAIPSISFSLHIEVLQ